MGKIKDVEVLCAYFTDERKAYKDFLPELMHFASKSGTYTVEAKNNVMRHYLARFHRKTHCYSHSIEMVEYSILLLMYKDFLLSMLC